MLTKLKDFSLKETNQQSIFKNKLVIKKIK